jgi:hypothetical protein
MNPLGRTALVALVVLSWCSAAFGQIPNNVKTAPDVSANRQQIDDFVNTNAKKLASDDPKEQSEGRDALIGGATVSGNVAGAQQPSPVYLDTYAQAIDKALAPLAANQDMRVRLNAAITAARVAEKSGNGRLAATAVRFMNDKQPAVALWGVKAGRAMLLSVLTTPGQNPLTPAFSATVQRHALNTIVTEVYDALTLDLFNTQPNKRPPAAAIKAAIPEMLKVFRMRVNGYAAGLPPDPAVDNTPAEWLSFQPVWSQMTPAQQLETVQIISDLLALCGQHAELMSGDERAPLLPIFRRTGKALQVVGDSNNLAPVSAAAKAVQNISAGTEGGDVRKATDGVAAALKAAPQFASIKDPPQLNLAPPPEPEAAPADSSTGKGAAPPADKAAPAPGPGPGPAPAPGTGKAPAPPATPTGPGPAPAPGPAPTRAPRPTGNK